ncbi:hypothetical protein S40288_10659, partial [Stachybotrys chartarum IBT 40288]
SVLEGITGIPFPRQEGLCTRFPTEIILRHSEIETTTIVAKVRPHVSRSKKARQVLCAYREEIRDISELPRVVQDVSKLMDLRDGTKDSKGKAFSSDLLRIEVTGPIGLHLSIVDLPGLISVPGEEQSEEDIAVVAETVKAYVKRSRTIILAVLQAGNDMANQMIIKIAKHYDPEGQRTVGIITKSDLINHEAIPIMARIFQNKGTIKLKLGFYLVKNPVHSPGQTSVSLGERSRLELEYFSSHPWSNVNLDLDRVGVEKLRSRLQTLLDVHIEKELPKVREDIKKILDATKSELKSLGVSRPTVAHARSFLTTLSMRFFSLAQAALEGSYHTVDYEFFMGEDKTRLRAQIQTLNTMFAATIRKEGNRAPPFVLPDEGEHDEEAYEKLTEKADAEEDEATVGSDKGQKRAHKHSWADIAKDHIGKVTCLIQEWLSLALARLKSEAESSVRGKIKLLIQATLEEAKTMALIELDNLLADEKRGPMTYNHYYTDNLQKLQADSQRTALNHAIKRLLSLHNVQKNQQGPDEACKEAYEQLQAYYKVAMKTFVDNVARQVIEGHIVSRLPQAFCPEGVSRLSDEELLRIGSERPDQVARREKLTAVVQGLEKTSRDLQKPAARA